MDVVIFHDREVVVERGGHDIYSAASAQYTCPDLHDIDFV
jgi:hypothetical protein